MAKALAVQRAATTLGLPDIAVLVDKAALVVLTVSMVNYLGPMEVAKVVIMVVAAAAPVVIRQSTTRTTSNNAAVPVV